MNYIVFDLEFNQPSSKEQLILDPFPFCNEVIQIGAVKMDEKYNIIGTIDILVNPFYYKHIGHAAKKRIEVYREHFQRSMSFPEAYKSFLDFCEKEYCLFAWGPTDIEILNENAFIHRLQPICNVQYFDVQNLFFKCIGGNKPQERLQDAVKKMRLEQYTAHNAFNDAYSTAEILCKLKVDLKKSCVLNNTAQLNSALYINEEYSSKNDALQRAQEGKIICSCGLQASIDHLIVLGKRKAISASRCICGKEYFIVAKFSDNKAAKKIYLQCYKQTMNERIKALYLKQKQIDDSIKAYAESHSRKYKK